jgi:hypothetical protein
MASFVGVTLFAVQRATPGVRAGIQGHKACSRCIYSEQRVGGHELCCLCGCRPQSSQRLRRCQGHFRQWRVPCAGSLREQSFCQPVPSHSSHEQRAAHCSNQEHCHGSACGSQLRHFSFRECFHFTFFYAFARSRKFTLINSAPGFCCSRNRCKVSTLPQ